jgi:hypothetical protein
LSSSLKKNYYNFKNKKNPEKSGKEGEIKMTKQLKLAVCERPFVKGVTQALIPEGSGYDLVREAAFAMDIYILEDTFCEVELYINFTNNKVIQMVENDCKNKGISLTKMYRGLDGEYHKG